MASNKRRVRDEGQGVRVVFQPLLFWFLGLLYKPDMEADDANITRASVWCILPVCHDDEARKHWLNFFS